MFFSLILNIIAFLLYVPPYKMGYYYYIIVQVYSENKWMNVEYHTNSGSYGCADQHYFYTHTYEQSRHYDPLDDDDDMGDHRYIFTYETLQMDFDRYKSVDLTEIKDYMLKLIKTGVTTDNLETLRRKIDNIIEPEEHPFLAELERYYNKCKKYLLGYDDVRVIYGLSP